MLSTKKSFEIFPRYNESATILESFVLNLIISVPLTNKQLFAPLQCKLKHFIFLFSVKLIEYFFFKVNVVMSNPCVGPSPRIRISFFLVIDMCRTHIYSKNYTISTKSITK